MKVDLVPVAVFGAVLDPVKYIVVVYKIPGVGECKGVMMFHITAIPAHVRHLCDMRHHWCPRELTGIPAKPVIFMLC